MKRVLLLSVLIFVVASLAVGVFAGLGRMGATDVYLTGYLHHGAIMVGGFLGTLIALEKIIPLKNRLLLLIPFTSAASVVMLWTNHFSQGVWLLIISSVGLSAVFLFYLIRHRELHLWLMFVGGISLFAGNSVLLSNTFYPSALPWWIAFLLFTIVSERLELSKFLPVAKTDKRLLLLMLGVFVSGILLSFHTWGNFVSGIALAGIAIWLMRHDVVRINLGKKGLIRFTGVALLLGYISLLLTGIFFIALPEIAYAYDAFVHMFFLGFVFSMIFAHGPIILPGVLGLMIKPYHRFLYAPLVLLHASLVVRIAADINLLDHSFRLPAGYLNGLAILLYFVALVTITIKSLRHAKSA